MATLTNIRIVSRSNERGQAIVEMALTLPLLLVIVLGIFDFGLLFQRYEVVTNAAREGARVAILPEFSPDQARLHARNYLDSGGLDVPMSGTVASCAGALPNGNRCISVVQSPTTIPASGGNPAITVNQMVVTVEYAHEHVFVGPILNLFGGSLGTARLRAVSIMRIE